MNFHPQFNAGTALTEDQMRRAAPSIFATTAHESRSERFKPIPTIEVLRALAREGFSPVGARQSTTRIADKAPFTKHLIRLRRMDNLDKYRVDDTIAEILLKNANDGTSAYELFSGLWRIRCLNGMVVKTGEIDKVKVRHTGDAIKNVIEGTYVVLDQTERALKAPQDWSQIQVGRQAASAFAEAAHVLRFGDEPGVQAPVAPERLLQVRRPQDTNPDFWTIFNVVQENAIKGGLPGRTPERTDEDGFHPSRRMHTRPIKGIDQDVKLNRALFVLGERMAQIISSR